MRSLVAVIVLIFLVITVSVHSQCNNKLGAWKRRADCIETHIEGARAVVNNKLYLFSGFYIDEAYWAPDNIGGLVTSTKVSVYDPVTDQWTASANCPFSLSHIQAVPWTNPPSGDARYIYIAGGFQGAPPAPAVNTVWRFDTKTSTYLRMPDLPGVRASGGLTIDSTHRLHYVGGLMDRDNDSADHWVLDLTDSEATWQSVADFSPKRNHMPAVSIGDWVYTPGGQYKHDTVPVDTRLMSGYNIKTNTWSQFADLPLPRTHAEASFVVANGRILMFGGRNNQLIGPIILSSIVEYNPTLNTWADLGNMPTQGISIVAALFKDIEIDGERGDYVMITSGGTDWNIDNRKSWIAKVTCDCCEVIDPEPEPQPPATSPESSPAEEVQPSSASQPSSPSVELSQPSSEESAEESAEESVDRGEQLASPSTSNEQLPREDSDSSSTRVTIGILLALSLALAQILF